MQLDPALQSAADNYKLLTNLVVPRPIAWVTTQSQSGVVNLAPYSFFNAVGSNPLYVVISVGKRDNVVRRRREIGAARHHHRVGLVAAR